MFQKILISGIDPSIAHTGWGIIEFDTRTDAATYVNSGVCMPSLQDGYYRPMLIAQELYDHFMEAYLKTDTDFQLCFMEFPTYEGSERGKEAAKKWDLMKLILSAGSCMAVGYLTHSYLFNITAAQWKDDVDKPWIKQRVEQYFPFKKDDWKREDEYEALGLALWGYHRVWKTSFFTNLTVRS